MDKKRIGILSSVLAAGALAVFALTLMVFDIKLNLATWLCWFTLDCVIVYQTWPRPKDGEDSHSKPWLMIGYSIGAGLVCLLLLFNGSWHWTGLETMVVCLAVASIAAMFVAGPKIGIIASTTAMIVAGVPSIIDGWHQPQAWVALFWGTCALASVLNIAATDRWSVKERLVPSASVGFNLIMAILMVM